MDILQKMDRLAEMARGEEIPRVDVNMEMLLKSEQKGPTIFPMAWAAGVAAVAAVLLLVVTLRLTTSTTGSVAQVSSDPLLSAAKVEMP